MTNVTNSEEPKNPKLSTTIEDYLSMIYVLERDDEPVVGVHLAELLGVTPPTVTNTLKRMTRDGSGTSWFLRPLADLLFLLCIGELRCKLK